MTPEQYDALKPGDIIIEGDYTPSFHYEDFDGERKDWKPRSAHFSHYEHEVYKKGPKLLIIGSPRPAGSNYRGRGWNLERDRALRDYFLPGDKVAAASRALERAEASVDRAERDFAEAERNLRRRQEDKHLLRDLLKEVTDAG